MRQVEEANTRHERSPWYEEVYLRRESRNKRSARPVELQKEFNGKKRELRAIVAGAKERISGSFRRINGKRHVPNESFERKEVCAQEELRDDTRACF